VTATVSVGTVPLAVAVDPVTNAIYVSNEGSNNVTVINGATNNVTAAVSAGTQPYAVAINSVTNTIYVANYNSATVTVIDGATNTVTATVAVGTNPQLLQFHSILLRTNTTGALHMPLTLSRSILSKSNSKMGPYRS
jgi:YVTN family beta-propeller protein